jgi:RHS repeat-associated protein
MCMVDVPTGRLNLHQIDAALPGPVPLTLFRHYRSTNLWMGDLGWGWGHALGYQLSEQGGQLVFRGGDGRRIECARPRPEAPSVVKSEGFACHLLPRSRLPSELLQRELEAGALLVRRLGLPTLLFDVRGIGRLLPWRATVHAGGGVLHVGPDAYGLPQTITDPCGRTLHVRRDPDGLLVRVRLAGRGDATGRTVVRYEYGPHKDLIAVHDAAGTRTFEYHDHRLVVHRNRAGGSCTSGYDAEGRCVRTSGVGGVRARSYRFEPAHGRTVVTDSLGNEEVHVHENGRITETHDRAGGVSRFDYDVGGRLVRTTDQSGFETTLCYDEQGRQVGKVAPDGATWLTETTGGVTRLVSPAGAVTEYVQDERGLIVAITTPGAGTTRIAYGADGRIAVFTLPSGKTVTHTWSDDGRVLVEADADGLVSERHYDLFGNLVLHEDPRGNVTRYVYGADGWLAEIVFPDGRARRYQSDAEGRVVLMRDEGGFESRWRYDAAGRSVEAVAATGDVFRSEYDTEDRLVAVQTPDGLWHRWRYDARGAVVEQQFADGRREHYAYDPRGLVVALGDPAGGTTAVERDRVGRPVAIRYPDGTEKTLGYDPDGRWTRVAYAGRVRERELTAEGFAVVERQDGFTFRREVDEIGALRALLDDAGRRVEYDHDADGRVVEARVIGGRWVAPPDAGAEHAEPTWTAAAEPRVHAWRWDRAGNWVAWQMPGGKLERRSYDARDRLVEQTVSLGDRVIVGRRYVYDGLGRLVELHDTRRGTRRYGYDAISRLTAVDASGRRRTVRYTAAGDPELPGVTCRAGHRVTAIPGAQLDYDANGFVVARRGGAIHDRFTWSTGGLLRTAELGTGERVELAYDAHARLVERRTDGGVQQLRWCGDWLWLVEDGGPSSTWFLHVPGLPVPVEQGDSGRAFTVHTDHVGRVLELIDDAGDVVWENPAGPWGEGRPPLSPSQPAAVECPLGLPGQLYEPATGLFYNRFRFYCAEAAHYLTPDPIGLWGGLDAYTYPMDPVNRTDPMGLVCRNKTDDPALYRADRRPPDQICNEGFKPWNPNGTMSLAQHVNGSNSDSPWVSTTYNRQMANDARDYGDRYDDDINKQYPGRAGPWIYEIENPGCGVEVDCDPGVIAHAAQYGGSPSEQEIAFKKTIPPDKIVGAVNLDTGEIVMC